MKQDFMFVSESVTEGHPDKLCDQIADAVVDRFLHHDPFSRVAAECAVAEGILFIAARFASRANLDIPDITRQVIHQVGYEHDDFNAKSCTIMTSFTELPLEASERRDERQLDEHELEQISAKNQGNVFGFACTQTAAMIPLPIWLAHKLARRLVAVRLQKRLHYLGPDGKTQVGVAFKAGRPYRIHSITLIAGQISPRIPDPTQLRRDLIEFVVEPAFLDEPVRPDEGTRIFVNPDGPFVGGPSLHSGLTGRKNAIDTYGEYARHSEAALSGKDPTRIDRVGAYAARYAAKNVVAAGLAEECEVQLSYSIGQARPVSIQVETHGSGRMADEDIAALVTEHFDFRPAGIIRQFNLRYLPGLYRGGFFKRLAAYGHVGRMDIGLPWERTDRVQLLR